MARITIKKTVPKYTSEKQSYDMTLEVTRADGMPGEIFVCKRGLPQLPPPGTQAPAGDATDWFISIADPVDLEEYPIDSPDTANDSPYFRLKIFTFRFRSVLEMDECWSYIMLDVQGLVDALNSATEEGSTETVEFA